MTEDTFDLDRACAEAMERLRAGIARHVLEQKWEWRKACADRMFKAVMREAIAEAVRKLVADLRLGDLFAGGIVAGGLVRSDFLENKTMEHL